MPGGDRRGPQGLGPQTGRAAGFCSGNVSPGYMNAGGRGFGGGGRGFFARGGGFGRGLGFNQGFTPVQPQQYSANDEKAYIENELSYLKNQVEAYENRLNSLRSED